MRSIIDFSEFKMNSVVKKEDRVVENNVDTMKDKTPTNDVVSLAENLQMLRDRFPEKILFTIKDTAAILNLSSEYIRKKIAKRIITSVKFGGRKMIHLNTVATLITRGI